MIVSIRVMFESLLNVQKINSLLLMAADALEAHTKALHLTLAHQYEATNVKDLRTMIDEIDLNVARNYELRLYSRDPRVKGCHVG